MANGIANMIANMRHPQPVTAFAQGQQMGQQNRLAQMQIKQAEHQMSQEQRQQDIQTLGGLLQGVQDEQGYQQALGMAQNMGVGEETLGGLQEAMPQFDPRKNQQLLSAYGFTPKAPKFGRPIQAMDESGNPVWVQVSDTGEARPVKGYGPIPKSGMSVTTPDGTTVQLGGSKTPGGKTEQRELAKFRVGNYKEIAERANTAEQENRQLYTAKNFDVSTGKLEPWKASVSAVAESFGMDPATIGLESATNPQAFTAIMENLVLNKMMAQKGPQTEEDARRITKTVASLGNTPEAKDFLLDSAIALNQLDIEKRDFYQDYLADKRTLQGADKAWRKRMDGVPLVAQNPNTGRPVFYTQFKEAVRRANPGMSEERIRQAWSEKYGD